MNGKLALRNLKALARRNSLSFRWVPQRGAGSHGTVYLGKSFAVLKDLKKDLGLGLLSDICNQLGIRKEQL